MEQDFIFSSKNIGAADMNSDSLNLLKRAVQSRAIGDYDKAKEYLDRLIETDPENHTLWYEKSKLPIVQEDNVIIRSRNVSLSTYQKLSLAEKNDYLQQCGFEIAEVTEIEDYLKVPHLVALQRNKYLKMAIRYAPEQEKLIYEAELNTLILSDEKRKQTDKWAAIILGLIALPIAIATVLSIMLFPNAMLFKVPMLVIITLLVPYILSVVGMTFSSKAKSNGAATVLGFVCNLFALIISNLTIINAIFLFLVK